MNTLELIRLIITLHDNKKERLWKIRDIIYPWLIEEAYAEYIAFKDERTNYKIEIAANFSYAGFCIRTSNLRDFDLSDREIETITEIFRNRLDERISPYILGEILKD